MRSPQKREFCFQTVWGLKPATSSLPWAFSLFLYPEDFGLNRLHNHTSTFLKTNLSIYIHTYWFLSLKNLDKHIPRPRSLWCVALENERDKVLISKDSREILFSFIIEDQ